MVKWPDFQELFRLTQISAYISGPERPKVRKAIRKMPRGSKGLQLEVGDPELGPRLVLLGMWKGPQEPKTGHCLCFS